MSDKHIFALHSPFFLALHDLPKSGSHITFVDHEIANRIVHVLRLHLNEEVIIFNTSHVVALLLTSFDGYKKGMVSGTVIWSKSITKPRPGIILYQGLLKREAFEDVAYYAAAMGICTLVPVISGKVQRAWGGQKELLRLERIMIGACEQAKQYAIPTISQPIQLADIPISQNNSRECFVYVDPQGQSLIALLNSVVQSDYEHINVLVGPEGGFLQTELAGKPLADSTYRLTQSILRSQEAVAVIIGSIRSVAQ